MLTVVPLIFYIIYSFSWIHLLFINQLGTISFIISKVDVYVIYHTR